MSSSENLKSQVIREPEKKNLPVLAPLKGEVLPPTETEFETALRKAINLAISDSPYSFWNLLENGRCDTYAARAILRELGGLGYWVQEACF